MNDSQVKQETSIIAKSLENILCLLFLSVFGILGVLTRYSLKSLFGPGTANITNDHSVLYPDLPSNMVGSFLMGWLGVVFKIEITQISPHLAIGLTTGYLGSLTTFSGWNQKMVELTADGHWVKAAVGFFVGLFLSAYSIRFGAGTASFCKSLSSKKDPTTANWRVNRTVMNSMFIIILCILVSTSSLMLKKKFPIHESSSELWLGCLIGPFGVWVRWYLSRFNGKGRGFFKFMPFGTLAANVMASCIMAALSTWRKAANSEDLGTVVGGVQIGFLGCLSTVSTFMAEYYTMENSKNTWTAYLYALVTIVLSFGVGVLIFDVPVWVKGYD